MPHQISVIKKIAKKHRLFVVEDACMGIGGSFEGNHPGTIGDKLPLAYTLLKRSTIEGGFLYK